MSTGSVNVNSLFQQAKNEGAITPASLKAITVVDMGAQIQAGLGISVDAVDASEVFLVGEVVDDSGSIRFAGNSKAVCDGHNGLLDALIDSKQENSILSYVSYLNHGILYPFSLLSQAVRMDSSNYNPSGGTPLYAGSIGLLGTILAKVQEFELSGVRARSASAIITDGHDESDGRVTAKMVASIVKDMLMRENHIIAGIGIDDGSTDFRQVFGEMGIRDEWILTPGNSPSEIRKAFGAFSKSAVRASQSAKSFSQTVVGGFGTP